MLRFACATAIVFVSIPALAEEPKHVTTTTTTTQTTTQTTAGTTDATPLECDDKDVCKESNADYDTVAGVRGSVAHVSGPQDATTVGATFSLSSEIYKTSGLLSARSSAIAGLGGGTGGVEGALGFGGTIGIRAPVTENQGPIARVGLSMELLGNQQFYFSHIDLPLGEIGYQISKGDTVLEIGARGAPLLNGRYDTGDTFRRELGTSFEWGGYLGAHGTLGRLDVSFTRIEDRSSPPDTPVSLLRGSACAYVTKLVAICADGMYIYGDEDLATSLPPPAAGAPVVSAAAKSFYGGLTLGFHW